MSSVTLKTDFISFDFQFGLSTVFFRKRKTKKIRSIEASYLKNSVEGKSQRSSFIIIRDIQNK